MADKDVVVDDSLPFDFSKSLEENVKMLKERLIKYGMTEKEAMEEVTRMETQIKKRLNQGGTP
jgi:hypothetical protein